MAFIGSGAKKQKKLVAQAPFIAGCVAIGVLPLFLSTFGRSLAIEILLYSIAALALNLLVGHAGFVSFGTGAFWGTGGYVVGILLTKGIISGAASFWLVMGLTVGVVFVLSWIFAYVTLRGREVFFVLLTFAFQELLYSAALKWKDLTGGEEGLPGIPPPNLGFLEPSRGLQFYYLVAAVFILSVLAMYFIGNSYFGHILRGIRENEARMKALGYNTNMFMILSIVISGLFIGIAGALYAYYTGIVAPQNLSWYTSMLVLITVILGGRNQFIGPIIGSIILILMMRLISGYVTYWLFVLGATFVANVMFFPQGISSYITKLLSWARLGYGSARS